MPDGPARERERAEGAALPPEALRAVLTQALEHRDDATAALAQLDFSGPATFGDDPPAWTIGPFEPDPSLTFRLDGQWLDPDGIGWTSSSLYNPTLIRHDETLHLFYRASPRKESLGSRIGHASRDLTDPAAGWVDDPANPVVRPTVPAELLGTEDPKVYAAEGRWWLFYHGIFPITEELADAYAGPENPLGAVGCDLLLAVSDDLRTWHKLGPVVDRSVTRLWAKGAVIPRDEHGNAVRIGGEYLMYVSEGFGGVLHLGRSTDLATWTFAPQEYLDRTALGGALHEVACAAVDGDRLVLDVFHDDEHGRFAASQVCYRLDHPTEPVAVHRGGSLSWGGLLRLDGRWSFAQGWDAPPGVRELYVYRATAAPRAVDPMNLESA